MAVQSEVLHISCVPLLNSWPADTSTHRCPESINQQMCWGSAGCRSWWDGSKSFLTAGIAAFLSTHKPLHVCSWRAREALTSLKLCLAVSWIFLQAFFLVDDDVLDVLHGQVVAEGVEQDVFQLLQGDPLHVELQGWKSWKRTFSFYKNNLCALQRHLFQDGTLYMCTSCMLHKMSKMELHGQQVPAALALIFFFLLYELIWTLWSPRMDSNGGLVRQVYL